MIDLEKKKERKPRKILLPLSPSSSSNWRQKVDEEGRRRRRREWRADNWFAVCRLAWPYRRAEFIFHLLLSRERGSFEEEEEE